MPPDHFRTELSGSFTYFYENIIKKASAGGRPLVPQVCLNFVTKAASLPAADPPLVLTATTTMLWYLSWYSAAPPPGPAAAEAAAPPRSGGATDASPGAACQQRLWQAKDFLIETCLSLHYCD